VKLRAGADACELPVAFRAEEVGEQRVVSDLRVRVEGEVVRGERQVRGEEGLEPAFQPPVDEQRLVAPEKTVVHEHELRTGGAGAFEQLA
jgi:hypothetical protein